MSYPTDCLQCRAIRQPCHTHRTLPMRSVTQAAYTRSVQTRLAWKAAGLRREARNHGTPVTGEARAAAAKARHLAACLANAGIPAFLPEGAR